eukprot:2565567-Amphidinium_carterae.1
MLEKSPRKLYLSHLPHLIVLANVCWFCHPLFGDLLHWQMKCGHLRFSTRKASEAKHGQQHTLDP